MSFEILPEERSYCLVDKDGEWRHKKISIMGAVASFISQLQVGQELTKVSLPAVFLWPFSLLEVAGYREMGYFEQLLELNDIEDEFTRFLQVLRWYLSTVKKESWYKKPYNPILGEIHECNIQSDKYGQSDYLAEQVSHHPPVTALIAKNDKHGIDLNASIGFGIKFGGNHVNIIANSPPAFIRCKKWNETYTLSKLNPDVKITNVIWGTRKFYWSGEVTFTTSTGRYEATLKFSQKKTNNLFVGVIKEKRDEGFETIKHMDGHVGEELYMTDSATGKRELFVNVPDVPMSNIIYKKMKDLDPTSSFLVWKEVSKCIVDNDTEGADKAKNIVENRQRERISQEEDDFSPRFFKGTENGWIYVSKVEEVKKMIAEEVPESPISSPKALRKTAEKFKFKFKPPERNRVKLKNSFNIWVHRYLDLGDGKLGILKHDKDTHLWCLLNLAGCNVSLKKQTRNGDRIKITSERNMYCRRFGRRRLWYPLQDEYKKELVFVTKTETQRWLDAINEQIEFANSHRPTVEEDEEEGTSDEAEEINEENDKMYPSEGEIVLAVERSTKDIRDKLSSIERKLQTFKRNDSPSSPTLTPWQMILILMLGIIFGKYF